MLPLPLSVRKKFLLPFLAFSILLGFLNSVGIWLELYWILPWYDSLLHFLFGGWVVAALFPLSAFFSQIFGTNLLRTYTCASLVLLPILIGLWEFAELHLGVTAVSDAIYLRDTASDVVLGVLGGIVAYRFIGKCCIFRRSIS